MRKTSFVTPQEERYFEDYVKGSVHEFGPVTVEEDEIIEFGNRFVPQPYHTDPELAKKTIYGGIIASGWHTAQNMSAVATNADTAKKPKASVYTSSGPRQTMPSISPFVSPASSMACFMATAKSETESISGTSPMELCPTPTTAYLSFRFVILETPCDSCAGILLLGRQKVKQGNRRFLDENGSVELADTLIV